MERLLDMSENTPVTIRERCEPSRTRSRELRLAAVTLLWAVTFVGATRLLKSELLPAGIVPWLVALAPSVAAGFVLAAYVRFLREADELQRLIQLQGLAAGFGGGFFVLCGYSLFEQLGASPAGIELVAVMPFLYVIGVLVGERKYR